jgi:hypothetical protein
MFEIGDIISVYSPVAGKRKYHLCICIGCEEKSFQFLFLNSKNEFKDTFSFPCERVPCIPRSETGITAFSFSMVPRYSVEQLKIFDAKKLGTLSKDVAQELLDKSNDVKSLPRSQLAAIKDALAFIALAPAPPDPSSSRL